MTPSSQLPVKEQQNFKLLVKLFEMKQLKKGLRVADHILKKFPNHGETISMKGLILNSQGKKEEAYESVRLGLRNDLKSHICWHVYGLVHRSDNNYDEAIKCYRNALRIDKDNFQILRDLSLLQIQMRDLEGFKLTRNQLLVSRPQQRVSWIGMAVAYHLLNQYDGAELALKTYEGFNSKEHTEFDLNELVLYRNSIMVEAGKYEDALADLDRIDTMVSDRVTWLETKGDLLLKMGRLEDASDIYRKLLFRNPENASYFSAMEKCVATPDSEEASNPEKKGEEMAVRLGVYADVSVRHPRALAPRRLPLEFIPATSPVFRTSLDDYIRPLIQKGVPYLHGSLASLYQVPSKVEIIGQLCDDYLESLRAHAHFSDADRDSGKPEEPPSTLLWMMIFTVKHLDKTRQCRRALELVDEALKHTPTMLDLYVVKARILKHSGDINGAADLMDEARALDTADRFLNSKCVKYMLRAGRVDAASETIKLFLREGDNDNLSEMQVIWYETEVAFAYMGMKQYALSLKFFHNIEKHFKQIWEDQFDYHQYCLRKFTLREYVRLLRLEDTLRGHSFYLRAAVGAIKVHLALFDTPVDSKVSDDNHKDMMAGLSESEKKKLRNKQRKAAVTAAAKEEGTKGAGGAKSGSKSGSADGGDKKDQDNSKGKKVDPDPEGIIVLKEAQKDPLAAALVFLKPLQLLARDNVETHIMACEIYSRRGKFLLWLQSLVRGLSVAPRNSFLHVHLIRFALASTSISDSIVKTVIDDVLPGLLGNISLEEYNERYSTSASTVCEVVASAEATILLDSNSTIKAAATIESVSDDKLELDLDGAMAALNSLRNTIKHEEKAVAFQTRITRLFPRVPEFKKANE